MKVGVFLGTQHPAGADMRRALEDHLEQTRAVCDAAYGAVCGHVPDPRGIGDDLARIDG